MSYTLTIDEPEKAAWFEQRRMKVSQEQLGSLFMAFLMQNETVIFKGETRADVLQFEDVDSEAVLRQREAILSCAGGWQDVRPQEEVIADIEAHRTRGREVVL